MNHYVGLTLRHARRVVITVIGVTVLLLGLLGIVLPIMPGFVLLPIGLAVLATEFVWARRLLKQVKDRTRAFMHRDSAAAPPRGAELSSRPPVDAGVEAPLSPPHDVPRPPEA